MEVLNYQLSKGDTVLLTTQLLKQNATFQFKQSGITASNVRIAMDMSTAPEELGWCPIEDADLIIDPNKPSDFIRIQNPVTEHVRFRLVTNGATAGSIVAIHLAK